MKVYIVSGWHHYGDTYVLDVYLSEEKAEAAAEPQPSWSAPHIAMTA